MPPKRDCHLIEVNLLSFDLRTALQSLEVDNGDISNPTDTGYVFALIFRNDFKQAECCDPIRAFWKQQAPKLGVELVGVEGSF